MEWLNAEEFKIPQSRRAFPAQRERNRTFYDRKKNFSLENFSAWCLSSSHHHRQFHQPRGHPLAASTCAAKQKRNPNKAAAFMHLSIDMNISVCCVLLNACHTSFLHDIST